MDGTSPAGPPLEVDRSRRDGRQHVFRYGDVVTLYEPDLNGYVCSGGAAEDTLWLDILKEGMLIPPNLKDTRFILTPRRQYDSKKLVEKRLRALGQDRWWAEREGRHADAELNALMVAEEQEARVNAAEGRRLQGTTVSYGSTVQLMHELTEHFLTVVKEVAEVQKSALRVVLMEGGLDGSQLIIQPAYRTQNGAARCLGNEVVLFNSLKFPGQSIGTGAVDWVGGGVQWKRTFGANVVGSREVNCGTLPLRVRMIPVRRHTRNPALQGVLRGGSYICIYHVDTTGFLIFDGGAMAWKRSKVGARALRRENHFSTGFWKIEGAQVEWAGEPLSYSQTPFRLQHVATGSYLTVTSHGVLESTTNNMSKDTWWYMEAFRADQSGLGQKFIFGDSTVYLRNYSGRYLGEGGNLPDGSGSAKMRGVVAGPFQERNAVVVHPLKIDHVRSVLHIARALAKIRQCAFQLETIPIARGLKEKRALRDVMNDVRREVNESASVVERLLKEMIFMLSVSDDTNPMTREGEPCKYIQKVMREQGGIEAVMRVLCAAESKGLDYTPPVPGGVVVPITKDGAYSLYDEDFSTVLHINQLCYRAIRQMVSGNRKNKMVCAPHIRTMQRHLGGELKSTFPLLEVFKSNRELLVHHISDDVVQRFVDFLASPSGKQPRFLRFLSELTRLGDEAMPSNQSRIVRLFLKHSPTNTTETVVHAPTGSKRRGDPRKESRFPEAQQLEGARAGAVVCELLVDAELVHMAVDQCHKNYKWPADVATPSGEELVLRIRDRRESNDWVYVNQWFGIGDKVFSKDLGENTPSELLLRYYVGGLDLLSDILMGRNQDSFNAIIRLSNVGIRYDQLMQIAFHPRMVFAVRRAALRLIRHLYLDQDPWLRAPPFPHAHATTQQVGVPCPPSINHVRAPTGAREARSPFERKDLVEFAPSAGFYDLKDAMFKMCSHTQSLDSRRPMSCQLIMEVLKCIRFMVDVGMMTRQDLGRWVPLVIGILDGRNDYEARPGARFVRSDGNGWVVKVKEAALGVLELMMDTRMARRLHLFFENFQRVLGLGHGRSSGDRDSDSDDSLEDHSSDTEVSPITRSSKKIAKFGSDVVTLRPAGKKNLAFRVVPSEQEMQSTDATTQNEEALPTVILDSEATAGPAEKDHSLDSNETSCEGGGSPVPIDVATDDEMIGDKAHSVTSPLTTGSETAKSPARLTPRQHDSTRTSLGPAGITSKSQGKAIGRILSDNAVLSTSGMRRLEKQMFHKVHVHSLIDLSSEGRLLQVLQDCLRYNEYSSLQYTTLKMLFRNFQQPLAFIRAAKQRQYVVATKTGLELMTIANTCYRDLILLSQHMLSDSTEKAASNGICNVLDRANDLCTGGLSREGEGWEPDSGYTFQTLLAGARVHEAVVRILKFELKLNDAMEAVNASRHILFRKCYSLLTAMVRGHVENQGIIFEHLDQFKSHMIVSGLGVSETIVEVLRNNHDLIRKALESDFLSHMLGAVARYGNDTTWLRLLDVMIAVNGEVVKKHQTVILKLLLDNSAMINLTGRLVMEGSHGVPDETLVPKAKQEAPSQRGKNQARSHDAPADKKGQPRKRGEGAMKIAVRKFLLAVRDSEGRQVMTRHMLLSRREYLEPHRSTLGYHALCIDLMARCCLGRNSSNEAKCRGLLPFDQLMHTLVVKLRVDIKGRVTHDDIRWIRAPFMRFITQCYFNTSDAKAASDVRRRDNRIFENSPGMSERTATPLIPEIALHIFALSRRFHEQHGAGQPTPQPGDALGTLIERYSAPPLSDFEDSEQMRRVHIAYVFDAALGVLQGVYSGHYQSAFQGSTAGRAVTRAVLEALVALHLAPKLPEHVSADQWNLLLSTTKLVISQLPEESKESNVGEAGLGNCVVDASSGADHDRGTVWNTRVNERYQAAIVQFARHIGVQDLNRMIGRGLRSLAGMFHSSPDALRNMVQFWRDHHSVYGPQDPFLLASTLRIVRGTMYLGSLSPPDVAWQDFIDTRPVKHDPTELRRMQASLSADGALQLAMEAIGNQDSAVSLAGERLCAQLLQDGNTVVQSMASRYGETQTDTLFYEGISQVLRLGSAGMRDVSKRRKKDASQDKAGLVTVDEDTRAVRSLEMVTLIHLLCVGGHRENQALLRGQPGHLTSHNILAELVSFSVSLLPELVANTQRTAEMLETVFIAILSTIHGPSPAGQVWLATNTDFLELTNRIIDRLSAVQIQRANGRGPSPPDERIRLGRVHIGLLRCLRAILEDVRPGQLALRVLEGVDWAKLMLLRDSTSRWVAGLGTASWEWEVAVEELMTYGFLVKEAIDLDIVCGHQRRVGGTEDDEWCNVPPDENGVLCGRPRRCNDFCLQHGFLESDTKSQRLMGEYTAAVEVDRGSRGVQRLLFSTHRIKHVVTASKRSGFREEWASFLRNSFDDNVVIRVRNISAGMPAVLYQIRHHTRLVQSPPPLRWVPTMGPFTRAVPFQIAVLISLMMVLLVEDAASWPWLAGIASFSATRGWPRLLVVLLAIVQFVATIVMTFVYIAGKLPTLLFKQALVSGRVRVVFSLPMSPLPKMYPVIRYRPRWWRALFLKSVEVHYIMLSPLFSLLGIVVSPFFFSYHLLNIARDNITQLVITAVSSNMNKLARTILLAMVILYFFSLASFLFFQEYMSGNCDSILSCVYLQVFYAAQGEALLTNTNLFDLPETMLTGDWDSWKDVVAVLFGAVWGSVFVVILLAIVSGIIIDSFGELRDTDQHVRNSMQNLCFICGRSRFELDESGSGFDYHLESEHNPVHWLFLRAYLESRPALELTGSEAHVLNCIITNSLGAYPGGKAYSLEANDRARAARAADEELRRSGFAGAQENDGEGEEFNLVTEHLEERLAGLESRMEAHTRLLQQVAKSMRPAAGAGMTTAVERK